MCRRVENPQYVAGALAIFPVAFGASLNAAEQGFVEGHLKIALAMATQASDDMPRRQTAAVPYSDYPLIVLTDDGKKGITPVKADENGNYRVPLPPGNYVLDVQDRVPMRVRATSRPFTVACNEIVRVDKNIFIGPGID